MRYRRLTAGTLAFACSLIGALPADADLPCPGPRQTSDPLSPPCIPSWSGDNGGVTWFGVTRTSVTLVLYNDLGVAGDLNLPPAMADDPVVPDLDGSTTNLVRTAKALVAFFNARFRTYGREVQIVAVPSSLGPGSFCTSRENDIERAIGEFSPFAIVSVGSDHGCAAQRAASAGVPTIGYFDELRAGSLGTAAPLIHSFAPSIEQLDDATAAFLCRSLRGRPARFAGGSLSGRQRRFALLYPADPSSPLVTHAAGITGAFQRTCEGSFELTRSYSPAMPSDLPRAVLEAFGLGLTTIVCLCPAGEQAGSAVTTAAALSYEPEWVWTPSTHMDRAISQRQVLGPTQSHLGITDLWVAARPDFQDAVLAATTADPGLTPNPRWTTDLYVALRTAFTAIQLAGPGLTPSNVRVGLASFGRTDLDDGRFPSGSFFAPTTSTFTDTFAAWWWDPQGRAPGDAIDAGCVRFMRDGDRFVGSWPSGDIDLFSVGACSGLLHRTMIDDLISSQFPLRTSRE